jgi:hypothetical protein
MHTPPLITPFVHPSLLHRLTFAPCLTQTPPLTTLFVHPSLLHRLSFAPCLTHTPPLTALFVHPSAEHLYLDFFLATFFLGLPSSNEGPRFLAFEAPFR